MTQDQLLDTIAQWDGAAVVTRFDRPTGSWIFIAIHDVTLGPASGGTRMKLYPSVVDGLRDAMRLAEGMTQKWAVVGFPCGGGKAVIVPPDPASIEGEARRALMRRYGAMIDALRGAFGTGPDLGTTVTDMEDIGSATRFVHGVDRERRRPTVDPGPYTAAGVLAAMRSGVRHVFGSDALEGRTVLIEGVGAVGEPLALLVADQGAKVLVSDIDDARSTRVAQRCAGESISPSQVLSAPCDVYAPCAVGGTLNRSSIPQLQCSVVAGSANVQLAEPDDALRLKERGVCYVPDYVANAGGAIALTLGDVEGRLIPAVELLQRVRTIGESVTAILEEAAERNETPVEAARRRVLRTLHRRNEETTS